MESMAERLKKIQAEYRAEYAKLSQETQQAILDRLREGAKFGVVRKEFGLSYDAMAQFVSDNMVSKRHALRATPYKPD